MGMEARGSSDGDPCHLDTCSVRCLAQQQASDELLTCQLTSELRGKGIPRAKAALDIILTNKEELTGEGRGRNLLRNHYGILGFTVSKEGKDEGAK